MNGYTKYVPDEYVREIGERAALIASRVESFLDDDGIARVSFSTLANIYGCSIDAVRDAVRKIEAAHIWKVKRGDGKGHLTEWERVVNLPPFEDVKGSEIATLKGLENCHPMNKDNIIKKGDINITEKNNSTMSVKRFKEPSVDEVRAYCEERQNGINAEHFVDFYIQKDWMVGKNRMKDWKAAVRTWEHRNKEEQSKSKNYGRKHNSSPAEAAAAAAVGIALADAELFGN